MGLQPGVGPTIAAPRARAASDAPAPNALQTVYGSVPVGIDGQVLVADSLQPLGVKFGVAAVPAGLVFPVAPVDGQAFLRTDLDALFEWKAGLNSWKPIGATIDQVIRALLPNSYFKLGEPAGNFADSGSAGIVGAAVAPGQRFMRGYRGNMGVAPNADLAIASFGDNYRFDATPYSVLVIHRTDTIAGAQRRLVSKTNPAHTIGWQLCYTAAGLAVFDNTVINAVSDAGATSGQFNLYAFTYDGAGTGVIYLNGLAKAVAGNFAAPVSADAVRLNGLTADPAGFGAPGIFHSLAFWNRQLSNTELDFIWGAF